MQDEEISFALKQKSNDVNGAAILCCWAIMASLAKEVQYKVGPEHVFAEQRYQQYKQLYEELQKTTQQDTAIPSGSIPDDDTSAFDVGMFDYK
jgi:hypothetical protein